MGTETGVIDQIIADVDMELTDNLKRAFKVCGCDCKCHCCGRIIDIGTTFKLSYIRREIDYFSPKGRGRRITTEEENDEMLCQYCNPEMLIKKRMDKLNKQRQYKGFTRAHKGS